MLEGGVVARFAAALNDDAGGVCQYDAAAAIADGREQTVHYGARDLGESAHAFARVLEFSLG